MNEKRLYRSQNERKIAGVAGGLAEHFNVDPVIVRVIFVCLFFCALGGGLIYIVLWIVLPDQPPYKVSEPQEPINNKEDNTSSETFNTNTNTVNMETPNYENKQPGRKRGSANLTAGLILITLGILFLCDRFIPNVNFGDLWPILLIVIGGTILFRGSNRSKKDKNQS
jgi:phage shock protein C